MEPVTIGVLAFAVMLVMMFAGVPIGFAMGLAGFGGIVAIRGFDPALNLLGQTAFETAVTNNLSIIPLFVLMGYFATNSGLSADLYRAFNAWFGYRRGGLALSLLWPFAIIRA